MFPFGMLVGHGSQRVGELVLLIDTQGGRLRLLPAESHDVEGGPFPEEWEYRLTLGGPSRTMTHAFVPATSVIHLRYAAEASTPWRGNGPIAVANLAGKLSAETVNALASESSGPVGRLLGIPVDGGDATVEALKADIRDATLCQVCDQGTPLWRAGDRWHCLSCFNAWLRAK